MIRRGLGLALLVLLFLLVQAGPRAQSSYHLNSGCPFNGNGTSASCAASGGAAGAWNTTASARCTFGNACTAGDTIKIAGPLAGAVDYVLTANGGDPSEDGGWLITTGGSAGNQVTFTAENIADPPVIRNCASGSTTQALCDNPTFTKSTSVEYVTISYLKITGGIWYSGAATVSEAALDRGIVISHNEFITGWGEIGDGNWTPMFLQGCYGAQIDHNYIHNVTVLTGGGVQASITGIKLYTCTNSIYEYNTIITVDSSQAGGIDDKQDSVNNIHRFNWIEDVDVCVRIQNQTTPTFPYNAIPAHGTQVYGNICQTRPANSRQAFKLEAGPIDSIDLHNNTVYGAYEGILGQYEPGAPVIANAAITNYNNIFAGITNANFHSYEKDTEVALEDYNIYDSDGSYSTSAHSSSTLALHQGFYPLRNVHSTETATPCTFVSAPTDFHLASGACQNGGKVGGTSAGASVDLGAYGVATCVGYTCGAAAPAPTVSSVSPSSGSASSGTPVTITGTGFVATPGVTFGGSAATGVTFVNATTLTCTTPAHAAGAVNVVVTNPDAQTGTGISAFTYTALSAVRKPFRSAEAAPRLDPWGGQP